jgi:hypothetical protein
MWRRIYLVWTDVSKELIASIFKVQKSASEEPVFLQTAATCSHWFLARWFSTLMMEAIRSSETSVHTGSTRRHIPEDGFLHSHRRENLKSYNWITVCMRKDSAWKLYVSYIKVQKALKYTALQFDITFVTCAVLTGDQISVG